MPTNRTDGVLAAGLLLLGLGLILHIVGVATPNWLTLSIASAHFGLFSQCSPVSCSNYDKVISEFRAVQGLTITGAVLAGLALIKGIIFSVMVYQGKSESKKLAVFTGLEALVAAVLIFSGFFLFAIDVYSPDNFGWRLYLNLYLGYSFILCVVASGLIGFAGILVWIGGNRIIAPAALQSGQMVTIGGPPVAVVYQASSNSVVYGQHFQPTQPYVMQQNPGPMYPPPQQAMYPPQQFRSQPLPPYQPPNTEKATYSSA